jgi:hypothetical protein
MGLVEEVLGDGRVRLCKRYQTSQRWSDQTVVYPHEILGQWED